MWLQKEADSIELVEQLHKALSDRHVERVHFLRLFSFLGFLLLYLTVLAMQQPSQQQVPQRFPMLSNKIVCPP